MQVNFSVDYLVRFQHCDPAGIVLMSPVMAWVDFLVITGPIMHEIADGTGIYSWPRLNP